MFEKDLTIGLLLDFYGDLLSERQRMMMELYYADDLSLAEIAENQGISRQGVRHILKAAEEELRFFEGKLGLAAQCNELLQTAKEMEELSSILAVNFTDERVTSLVSRMRRCATLLLSKSIEQEEDSVSEFNRETDECS